MAQVKLTDDEIYTTLGVKRDKNSTVKSLTPIRGYKSSNNPPSVSKPGGTLPKVTVPKQLGIGFNQPTVKPQPLPYAVSSFMPQAATTTANIKTNNQYLNNGLPLGVVDTTPAQTYKDKATVLKQQIAEESKKITPYNNVGSSLLAATYTQPTQTNPKVGIMGTAPTVTTPTQQDVIGRKIENMKGELAQAQNAGYMADYSQQWIALSQRPDAEAIKQNLARMATLKASFGTDYGQNVAAMNEYQRIRGSLDKLGINAEGLADWLQRNADYLEAAREVKEAQEFATERPVLASIKSIGQNLVSGQGGLQGIAQQGMNTNSGEYRPINIYGDAFDASREKQTIRGTVGENIAEKHGQAAKFLYDIGMSMGDSGVVALTGGLTGLGGAASVILGSAVASDTMMDVVERGGSTEQAVASGLLAGAAETVFESISLGKFLDTFKAGNAHGLKAHIKNILLQGATEMSEEMATEIANIITDDAVMGSLSELNQMRANGATEADINKEIAKRVALAGLGGFLSGGVFGGIASVSNREPSSLREKRAFNALENKYGTKVNVESDIADTNAQYAGNEDRIDISAQPRVSLANQHAGQPITNKQAEAILGDADSVREMTEAGVDLSGTSSQRRKAVKDYVASIGQAETPAQPALPYNPNTPKPIPQNPAQGNSSGTMGFVANPELVEMAGNIRDAVTPAPNPEGSRTARRSVIDEVGSGEAAFAPLNNLLAQADEEARNRPAEEASVAEVLTERPRRDLRGTVERAVDWTKRKIIDSGNTINTIAKAVGDKVLYPLFNNAKQARQAAMYMIGDAQTDINGNRVGESLISIFRPIKERGDAYFRDFSTYLYHLHNIDRMTLDSRGVEIYRNAIAELEAQYPALRGATRQEAERLSRQDTRYRNAAIEWIQLNDVVNNLRNKPVFGDAVTAQDSANAVRNLLADHPEFAELADRVYAYNRNLMKYRVDAGLVSQRQADILNELYPHYVPTFRNVDGTRGRDIDRDIQVDQTIRRAAGGDYDLMPIDGSMAEQTLQTVKAARMNLFGARLLETALTNQDKVGKHVRGVVDRYNTYDMDAPPNYTGEVTIYVGGRPVSMDADAGVMEAFQALQPNRLEGNVVYDAIVNANKTFKTLVTGANPAFLVKNFARDLQDAGLYAGDLREFARNFPRAWNEIKNNGELWQLYNAMGGTGSSYFDYEKGLLPTDNRPEWERRVGNVVERVEDANRLVEQFPRFAEFMSVLEKEGRTYEGVQKALLAAADVTVNFGRSGTVTKILNQSVVPFLNPSVQGAEKFVRRFAETRGARAWLDLVGRCALLGVAPALLNELLHAGTDDEEEYEMLNDRTKEGNYVFSIGDGMWAMIPKGRAVSIFGSAAQRTARTLQGKEDAWDGFIEFATNQVGATDPFTGHILSSAINTDLFDPQSPGKTWYGGDIEPQRLRGLPPGERYDEMTDKFSKWLGKQLNISPKKINHLLDSYTGVIGDFVLPALTPQAEGIPLVSSFVTDSKTSNKLQGEFYDKLDELQQDKNSSNPTPGSDLAYSYLSSVSRDVSEINKQIRTIEASETLSDKEKRKEARKLADKRNDTIKKALDVLPQYSEKAAAYKGDPDDAKREVNREQFGAKYALKKYNKDIYAKAQKANKSLIPYEAFYDAYFAQKDVKGDKDRNGKTIASSESGNKKLAVDAATPGLTQKQREVLYEMFGIGKSVWSGYVPRKK